MEENENNGEQKNNKLFSFATINKYFIIPFLCPIFCMIGNFFIVIVDEDEGVINKEFLLSILECLSFTGGGLLYFISSLREKTEETRDKATNNGEGRLSIKLIYNETSKYRQNNLKIYSILLIASISISFFDICEMYSVDKNTFEVRFYIIFFLSLFSKIILKNNIYNHQILSLSMSFIGLILIFIPTILVIKKDDIKINIYFFIASIAFSLYLILVKYLTHTYYISIYLCLLFIGIASTLITLIYFLVYSLIVFNDLSFIIDSMDFSKAKTGKMLPFYIFLIYIFGAFLQTFSFLVIYYFSPTLLIVTDIISPLLLWIIKIIFRGETYLNIIFFGFGYSIALIASLIYNEIIICNFCNLNKYTKKYLEVRQKEEFTLLKRTELENSQMTDNNGENNDNNDNNNNNNNEDNNESENDESNEEDD